VESMWAKIKIVPSGRSIIYLPSLLSTGHQQTNVLFGGKSTFADIEYLDDLELTAENSFQKPVQIMLSDKLRDEIFIAEPLVYQLKISASGIAIGPVIGLLLGNDTRRYNPKHMKKYSDRFGIYHQVGGLIYAFSPEWIHWNNRTVYGLYYNYFKASWDYGFFPLPEVIYRRDFHTGRESTERLAKFTGNRLFNSHRFSKYELYNFIKPNPELNKYLPPTELSLHFDQVREFINRHLNAILKPIDLSRGRGICVIEKAASRYKISDYRSKIPIASEICDDEELKNFFSANQELFSKYLIQKYLPLAKIGNSRFDIRVVMQKHPDKAWGSTGIECRVSNGSSHLTNISRGGYALSLDEALRQAFTTDYEMLEQQIHELCDKFCLYMDTSGEHYAEFGLDIAVDNARGLWLIEANVFPSFKGFRKMDPQIYLSIRYTPLLYALSLTRFGG
jgi:glutathione synthase/RimK-type ligase-like ATP-grasp enzyme